MVPTNVLISIIFLQMMRTAMGQSCKLKAKINDEKLIHTPNRREEMLLKLVGQLAAYYTALFCIISIHFYSLMIEYKTRNESSSVGGYSTRPRHMHTITIT